MQDDLPQATFPDNRQVAALGQGTWHMGESGNTAAVEARALRAGLDLGLTLIDTAEMYADAESVVGEAIRGRRDEVLLVSKVLPSNASAQGTIEACERSLRRLGTDRIDLYLLHWRGRYPLAETVEAFERLKEVGKIGAWGVSNFDVHDLEELLSVPAGENVAANQVLYNPARRGIEFDLLPWSARHGIPVMAYSPLDEGRLVRHAGLARIAGARGVTAAQLALAFVLARRNLIAIPKSSSVDRVEENRKAAGLRLTSEDMAALDTLFPPPMRRQPLEMI